MSRASPPAARPGGAARRPRRPAEGSGAHGRGRAARSSSPRSGRADSRRRREGRAELDPPRLDRRPGLTNGAYPVGDGSARWEGARAARGPRSGRVGRRRRGRRDEPSALRFRHGRHDGAVLGHRPLGDQRSRKRRRRVRLDGRLRRLVAPGRIRDPTAQGEADCPRSSPAGATSSASSRAPVRNVPSPPAPSPPRRRRSGSARE